MLYDVLILYEHVARELKNACILKVLLEREGYSVKIENVAWRKGLLNLLCKPKLIVHPSCHNGVNVSYIKHNYVGYYNGDYKILNLYSEQLTYDAAADILAIKGEALHIYHIAWGQYTHDKMIASGICDQQICIAGSQRLDFINPKFKNLNPNKADLAQRFNLDINKKWIMVVGNFTALSADMKAEKKGGNDFTFFDKTLELTRNTYFELLNWYKELLLDDELKDNIEVIYRYHPNELVTKDIKKLSDEFKNFHIIGDLTISEWAVNIDLSYVWTSTSSVELANAGVPVLCMMPYNIEQNFRIPLVDSIEKANNVETFLKLTKMILSKSLLNFNKNFKNGIEYYYSKSKFSASENIVTFIKKILISNEYIVKTEYSVIKAIPKTIIYIIKNILRVLNIKISREHVIRYRDYRTQRFIENYCQNIDKIIK